MYVMVINKTQIDELVHSGRKNSGDGAKMRENRNMCTFMCIFMDKYIKKKRTRVMFLLGWYTPPAASLLPVSFTISRLVLVCVYVIMLSVCLCGVCPEEAGVIDLPGAMALLLSCKHSV